MDRKVRGIAQLVYRRLMNQKLGLPPWVLHRKVAIPPYTKEVVDFYTVKLSKLLMAPFASNPRAELEINHCREVLYSHQRVQEMELRKLKLHDHQNPPSI